MDFPADIRTNALTNIELEAFLDVGVAAASRLLVLLQHQDFLPRLGQRGRDRQPADAAANYDHVQVVGHLIEAEACEWRSSRSGKQESYKRVT